MRRAVGRHPGCCVNTDAPGTSTSPPSPSIPRRAAPWSRADGPFSPRTRPGRHGDGQLSTVITAEAGRVPEGIAEGGRDGHRRGREAHDDEAEAYEKCRQWLRPRRAGRRSTVSTANSIPVMRGARTIRGWAERHHHHDGSVPGPGAADRVRKDLRYDLSAPLGPGQIAFQASTVPVEGVTAAGGQQAVRSRR